VNGGCAGRNESQRTFLVFTNSTHVLMILLLVGQKLRTVSILTLQVHRGWIGQTLYNKQSAK
jgi:hypothetical protein